MKEEGPEYMRAAKVVGPKVSRDEQHDKVVNRQSREDLSERERERERERALVSSLRARARAREQKRERENT